MTQLAVVSANVAGDVGNQGISRMHFVRQDAATVLPADVAAAAAAWRAYWNALTLYMPNDITWSWQPTAAVIESTSAIIQAYLQVSPLPPPVSSATSGTYAAGSGARLTWKTNTVHGRRFMRAATYLIPLAGGAYTSLGAIAPSLVTALQTNGTTFLAALNTAALSMVSYHRPAKGLSTGGAYGPVVALQVSTTVSALRSRRS